MISVAPEYDRSEGLLAPASTTHVSAIVEAWLRRVGERA